MNNPSHDSAWLRQSVAGRIQDARRAWRVASDVAEIRASFETLFDPANEAPPGDFQDFGVIRTERFGAEYRKSPVLFLHGGGYQIGSLRSHRRIMSTLSERAERPVVGVEYRLAPEHRFPAAIEDALSVYRYLCGERPAPQISLAGDSAGGGLALALCQRIAAENLPTPASAALISPWLDLELTGASYKDKVDEDIFSTPEALHRMARSYLGRSGDPADPLASPIHMVMRDLPPVLVHAGEADITLSDSLTFAERARTAGASVNLRIWPGMFHHFQMFPELPESQESLSEIGAFLR